MIRNLRANRSLVRFLLAASLTWVVYAVAFDVMPTVALPLLDGRMVALACALNAIVVLAGQPLVTRWLLARAGTGDGTVLAGANLVAAAGVGVLALLPWLGGPGLLLGVLIFSASELVWAPLYDTQTVARAGALSRAGAFGLAGCVFGVAESTAAWVGVAVAGHSASGHAASGHAASGHAASGPAVFVGAAVAGVAAAALFASSRWLADQPPPGSPVNRPPVNRPPESRPPVNRPPESRPPESRPAHLHLTSEVAR